MLKEDHEFLWHPQHPADFKTIINELCSPKLLKYYDGNKKLYLEVDASQKAIGMALMQSVQEEHASAGGREADDSRQNFVDIGSQDKGKSMIPTNLMPVAYGSKTLTEQVLWY